MKYAYREAIYKNYQNTSRCVSLKKVGHWLEQIFYVLYPVSKEFVFDDAEDFERHLMLLEAELTGILSCSMNALEHDISGITRDLFDALPDIKEVLDTDVEAIYKEDPAAVSREEIVRCYPGIRAITTYRIAHRLWKKEVPIIPRMMTEYAHSATGIDIHPGAKIGSYFCIDHGTGIVIGATAVLGKNVKIYQGVTLGGLSVKKAFAGSKRHPTIKDNVVIYAGATILGGETVIGENAIIGGNTFITRSVAPHKRVYYSSSHQEY